MISRKPGTPPKRSETRTVRRNEGTRNKPETNVYRVIHCPEVAVRDIPWGTKVRRHTSDNRRTAATVPM